MWIEATLSTLFIAYGLIVLETVVAVVLENRQPSKTIAWILVLVTLPVVGLVFFYFFGQNIRKERTIHRKNFRLLTQRMLAETQRYAPRWLPDAYKPLIHTLEREKLAIPTTGNSIRHLVRGADFLDALLKAIGSAEDHIHLETYIIEDDAVGRLVRDALIDKAREGVEVRLIYDDVGCWRVPASFFRPMVAAGIRAVPFLPVRFPALTRHVNYRNHRKICVIDGRTGFIGGMNIARRYVTAREGRWVDLHLRIDGPAVGSLQRMFLTDWHVLTDNLITDERYFPILESVGPGALVQILDANPVSQYPEIAFGLTWIAMHARKYLYVQTPYFMPTEPFLQALQTAALSGVDVRLMVPLKPDGFWLRWANDSYFPEVLRAGIRIFTYSAGFLHSKCLVADDSWCTVGSANMDFRSFEDNFEANAFVYDEEVACRTKEIFLRDLEACQEVKMEEWEKRPKKRRLAESLTRILAPLF